MKKMTLIATGDAFITRRFPEGGYEGFEQVRDVISQYDVKFSNLEMTFHNEEGYPAAFSGGTWAMADPRTLDDMRSFGFDASERFFPVPAKIMSLSLRFRMVARTPP